MIGGISFSATSITSGLDADKPANPKPGSQYLATDTKIVYVCYDAGSWVDAAPAPLITTLEEIHISQGGTYTLKSNSETIVSFFIEALQWETMFEFTVSEFINISKVNNFTVTYESSGGTTYKHHKTRLLINDLVVGQASGSTMTYVEKTVQVNTPLLIGDNVKIQCLLDTTVPGAREYLGIRNIVLKGDITRVLKKIVEIV